jgi:glycerophosphoryl diester phosphodiesterase
MLSKKQTRHPIFFLTHLGSSVHSDPRCNSVEASIHYAKSLQLVGLVCPSTYLVQHVDIIKRIKESGLRLMTWGKENSEIEPVALQKELGVDGIIADHIAYIAKHHFTKK